ncbi:MAG: putative rane protein [Herbinix sp.]|jgi:hypothetical protein|nr:putative rane protein [Herbinix sp.]
MEKVKRVAALVGVVLMVSMYVIFLIISFFATEKAPGLFLSGVFLTLIIPIMIYGFVVIYKFVHRNDKKDTEGDFNSSNENDSMRIPTFDLQHTENDTDYDTDLNESDEQSDFDASDPGDPSDPVDSTDSSN